MLLTSFCPTEPHQMTHNYYLDQLSPSVPSQCAFVISICLQIWPCDYECRPQGGYQWGWPDSTYRENRYTLEASNHTTQRQRLQIIMVEQNITPQTPPYQAFTCPICYMKDLVVNFDDHLRKFHPGVARPLPRPGKKKWPRRGLLSTWWLVFIRYELWWVVLVFS